MRLLADWPSRRMGGLLSRLSRGRWQTARRCKRPLDGAHKRGGDYFRALPGFDLAEPMSVLEYRDPFCGYRFCKAGQAWIGQDIDGYQNQLQFALIHSNYLVPGPDLPTADGLYAIRGGHQAFHNFVAFCAIGECNSTQFQSLRIAGAGSPVPEPGSLILMLGSLGMLAGVRRHCPAGSSQG